ncbi:conserved hypothetical protein [Pediculus humanus corporis]|uniref:tRNA pseudouridine(55) synthase n=1 Tax=Pediculus humanus subsp. corporis TaxID=121224 RepID=E0VC88_PEDHC|nr:uncharacterized protein Phum_PHUM081770 [Pediculus humanus corporis]EEB10994.1 conserved hypothetical protein [Pediculus humanus corporis]
MGCQNDMIKVIIEDLAKNNLCNYCILRYLNEKNSNSYNDVDGRIKKLLNAQDEDYLPEIKKTKLNPCSACLGLLQLSDSSEQLNTVINSVIESGYDCDDVTFALSLPISFLIRSRSIWLHLINKFKEFFENKYYPHEIKQEYLVVSIKEVWKWLSSQKIAKMIGKNANNGVDGNFHVNIHINYDDDNLETASLFKMFPEEFQYRNHHKRKFHGEILTRKNVEKMLLETDLKSFDNIYPVPPKTPNTFFQFSTVQCMHDSIYVAGRYNKLSRNLSQTPWMINGERRMESSVEEIIEKPISNYIKNSGTKFSSSGREDVDVRTLGNGRPFVVEILNPRKVKIDQQYMLEIEKEINKSTNDVFVRDLQIVQKKDLHHIKAGEETKTKTYTCFCLIKLDNNDEIPEIKEKLNNLSQIKDLVINQRTPIRVLHRRPLAVRPRTVYWLKADFHEIKNNHLFFKLSLKVGAGTYIKEFVHGDFGRTTPNLSEILEKETDILALDVEEVALQWPPN